jgi:hypothetical protein
VGHFLTGLDKPLPVAAAEEASNGYPGHRRHLSAGCFACGTARPRGDGLRIFPGLLPGEKTVGAPWVPETAGADEHGIVCPEIVWAALDCPQIWTLILTAPPDSTDRIVTGAMEAERFGSVQAGEHYAIVGWPLGGEGRRFFAAAALFSSDGEILAVSRQTAVITPTGTPLGLAASSA